MTLSPLVENKLYQLNDDFMTRYLKDYIGRQVHGSVVEGGTERVGEGDRYSFISKGLPLPHPLFVEKNDCHLFTIKNTP